MAGALGANSNHTARMFSNRMLLRVAPSLEAVPRADYLRISKSKNGRRNLLDFLTRDNTLMVDSLGVIVRYTLGPKRLCISRSWEVNKE